MWCKPRLSVSKGGNAISVRSNPLHSERLFARQDDWTKVSRKRGDISVHCVRAKRSFSWQGGWGGGGRVHLPNGQGIFPPSVQIDGFGDAPIFSGVQRSPGRERGHYSFPPPRFYRAVSFYCSFAHNVSKPKISLSLLLLHTAVLWR